MHVEFWRKRSSIAGGYGLERKKIKEVQQEKRESSPKAKPKLKKKETTGRDKEDRVATHPYVAARQSVSDKVKESATWNRGATRQDHVRFEFQRSWIAIKLRVAARHFSVVARTPCFRFPI